MPGYTPTDTSGTDGTYGLGDDERSGGEGTGQGIDLEAHGLPEEI